jgi:hypothetical protein
VGVSKLNYKQKNSGKTASYFSGVGFVLRAPVFPFGENK